MKDWIYIGDFVERPDGIIDKIIRITEDKGVLLEMGTRYYCRTELKPFKDKPTKQELIDKAIDDLGGDISNAGMYGWEDHTYLKYSTGYAYNYVLCHTNSYSVTEGLCFCTIEEFEQRKKEREMEKNNWYDYDKERNTSLPPVDAVCEYTLSDGRTWYKCKVISHNNLVLDCPHLESIDNNGLQVLRTDVDTVKFRPLDWDKLSNRNITVLHAMESVGNIHSYGVIRKVDLMALLTYLYDQDMLKLPESSKAVESK